MWEKLLIISVVQVIFITCQEQVATVRKRESAINVTVETVKLLDFHDETVINNLVKSVVETEAEELVEQILHMLSDPDMSKSTKKMREGLKKIIRDPQYQKDSKQKNQKSKIPLPNGIIKLLKANMAVDEKKSVLEKVFQKVNQINSLSEDEKIEAIPRVARFTNQDFPYDSLLNTENSRQVGQRHDFSNCEVRPDGSCCVTKVQDKERLERDDIKECWHKNVTTCYDSYVTEFTSAEEEECEDVFYKSCVIDFNQVPFEYDIRSCHTPMIKDCSGNGGGKEICREFYEPTCNTTYDDQWKPQTSCSRHAKEICTPDTCQVVPGKEKCMTKTLTSTSYKPVETCDLQPQTHCTIITKPVPQLKLVPNCYEEEKEVCRRKQGQAKPVGRQTLVKWCKRADDYGSSPFPQKGDTSSLQFSLKNQPGKNLPTYGNNQPQFTISDLVERKRIGIYE